MEQDLVDIALFPIPDLVAFPGATVPLHVFEPRYRRMIRECVEGERMIGVCHTRKTISAAPSQQSVEQALSSNQATYQPQPVFSAGQCEIRDELEDGRLLVLIRMQGRYRLVSEQQALPYRIARCEPVTDDPLDEDVEEAARLKGLIIERMLELARSAEGSVATQDLRRRWQSLSQQDFSFQLFEFVRFDADLMQDILESTDPMSRLRVIADVLQAA
jgi:Lon protease-like protein